MVHDSHAAPADFGQNAKTAQRLSDHGLTFAVRLAMPDEEPHFVGWGYYAISISIRESLFSEDHDFDKDRLS